MKLGSNDISKVYIGSNEVNSIYLGTNLVWSGMDVDYKAVLDYATTQGYTLPSASQQLLQNQLVIDLKDAGIWSKLDTFAVFATDGDSDFALIDWIRLSQYTAVNSPTFTTNEGFAGTGSSAYINTNFNETNLTNSSINDMSVGFWEFNTSFSRAIFIGKADSLILNQQFNNSNGFIRINERGGARPSASTYSNGLVVGNRTSSSNLEFYAPNKTKSTYNENTTSLFSGNVDLLRYSNVYTDLGCTISLFYLGQSLNSTEIDNYYTIIGAYINSL